MVIKYDVIYVENDVILFIYLFIYFFFFIKNDILFFKDNFNLLLKFIILVM